MDMGMDFNQNVIDKEFEEWVKTMDYPDFLGDNDVGKVATIKDVNWAQTKYGTRLRILLELEGGEERVLFLSKSYARVLANNEYFGLKISSWIGKKTKIISVLTTSGKYKPMLGPYEK